MITDRESRALGSHCATNPTVSRYRGQSGARTGQNACAARANGVPAEASPKSSANDLFRSLRPRLPRVHCAATQPGISKGEGPAHGECGAYPLSGRAPLSISIQAPDPSLEVAWDCALCSARSAAFPQGARLTAGSHSRILTNSATSWTGPMLSGRERPADVAGGGILSASRYNGESSVARNSGLGETRATLTNAADD